MKTNFFIAILLVSSFCFSTVSTAATVFADGKEWMQVTDSTNISFNTMAGYCDRFSGECHSGNVNGNSLVGWTWAGNNDLYSLFDSFIGAETVDAIYTNETPYEKSAHNSLFAPAFFSLFDNTSFYGGANRIDGITREVTIHEYLSLARATYYVQPFYSGNADFFQITEFLPYASPFSGLPDLSADPTVGHWIYRDVSTIPIPGAAFMFAPGLLGLLGFRRKFFT